jgi:hypothetical protein
LFCLYKNTHCSRRNLFLLLSRHIHNTMLTITRYTVDYYYCYIHFYCNTQDCGRPQWRDDHSQPCVGLTTVALEQEKWCSRKPNFRTPFLWFAVLGSLLVVSLWRDLNRLIIGHLFHAPSTSAVLPKFPHSY